MSISPTLHAGVARRDITPPKGIYQIGYGDRTKGNTGVHDALTATALVLDDGTKRIAIVALDMLTINEFIVDRVAPASHRPRCCCAVPIPTPVRSPTRMRSRPARTGSTSTHWWTTSLPPCRRQAQDLMPARLEYSHGEAEVGINRRERKPDGHMEIGRNPAGARDKSVQVVSVLSAADGRRLGTLVNYACHGTVLGPDNLLISADWIGAMRRKVEAELGGLALFLQGATANINPDMYWEDAHAFEKVTEQGTKVADAVLTCHPRRNQKGSMALPLGIERGEAWMPTETPVTTSRPPKNYGKPLAGTCQPARFHGSLCGHPAQAAISVETGHRGTRWILVRAYANQLFFASATWRWSPSARRPLPRSA